MSFDPSNETKTAENNLGGISNTALNSQLPMFNAAGQGLLGGGASNVTSGTNFLNTILGGNQANTAALLQPNIQQIQQGNANALNSINTLAPRGGGRSGALFGQSFAPTAQIGNLFNGARASAATALPQIGLQQQGLGANLLGMGNQALGAATGASGQLGNIAQQQQQMSNSLAGGIGGGIMNLLTAPLGGTALGSLGGLFSGGTGGGISGGIGGLGALAGLF